MLPRATTGCVMPFNFRKIMRDEIAQGVQGGRGEAYGHPWTESPAPESGGNGEPAPATIPKEEEEEERKRRNGEGSQGEERREA